MDGVYEASLNMKRTKKLLHVYSPIQTVKNLRQNG
jgi:hypothetical protein